MGVQLPWSQSGEGGDGAIGAKLTSCSGCLGQAAPLGPATNPNPPHLGAQSMGTQSPQRLCWLGKKPESPPTPNCISNCQVPFPPSGFCSSASGQDPHLSFSV